MFLQVLLNKFSFNRLHEIITLRPSEMSEREKKNVYIFYDTHSVASRDRCVVGAVEQARCAVG